MARTRKKTTKKRARKPTPRQRKAYARARKRGFHGPRFCTLETKFTEDREGCVQGVSTYIDRKTKRKKTWSCWWCPNNEAILRGPCEQSMLETDKGCPPIHVKRTKE